MKKQIVFAVLTIGAIVLGTNNIKAQTGATATTTVKMVLADVISMEAPATQVTFTYDNAAAYNTDQKQSVVDNLKVTSTKPFGIKVKANGPNFVSGTNLIPVNVMTIKPVAGGTKPMGGTRQEVPILSISDQVLIPSAPMGSQVTLNIDYIITASKASSADILGKPSGTYVQTVTYTATAL